MNPKADLTCSGDCMQLSGTLDFATVVLLEQSGARWLRDQAPGRCRLDMSGVSRCNSAGTALLLAWLRCAASAGKTLRVENPPESLLALLQLAGLDKVLSSHTLPLSPEQGIDPQAELER